jgi:hypothetical protein
MEKKKETVRKQEKKARKDAKEPAEFEQRKRA